MEIRLTNGNSIIALVLISLSTFKESRTPPQADGVWKQTCARIPDSDCKPQSFAAKRRGICPLLDSSLISAFTSISMSFITEAIASQFVEDIKL